jgi:hypothetical protein
MFIKRRNKIHNDEEVGKKEETRRLETLTEKFRSQQRQKRTVLEEPVSSPTEKKHKWYRRLVSAGREAVPGKRSWRRGFGLGDCFTSSSSAPVEEYRPPGRKCIRISTASHSSPSTPALHVASTKRSSGSKEASVTQYSPVSHHSEELCHFPRVPSMSRKAKHGNQPAPSCLPTSNEGNTQSLRSNMVNDGSLVDNDAPKAGRRSEDSGLSWTSYTLFEDPRSQSLARIHPEMLHVGRSAASGDTTKSAGVPPGRQTRRNEGAESSDFSPSSKPPDLDKPSDTGYRKDSWDEGSIRCTTSSPLGSDSLHRRGLAFELSQGASEGLDITGSPGSSSIASTTDDTPAPSLYSASMISSTCSISDFPHPPTSFRNVTSDDAAIDLGDEALKTPGEGTLAAIDHEDATWTREIKRWDENRRGSTCDSRTNYSKSFSGASIRSSEYPFVNTLDSNSPSIEVLSKTYRSLIRTLESPYVDDD